MNESHDYIAPRNSPGIILLAKLLWPLFMRFAKHVTKLEVTDDGLERLAALAGRRVVICPNHAYQDDAEVIFGLSRAASEDFYYLTAHEIFHGHGGWNASVLPEVGCYSITRGVPDPDAYRTTRQILIDNERKLVIFPEGEISHFNEVVMPLEPGVVRISMSALQRVKSIRADDDIVILPLGIVYNYVENIQAALESSLARLEGYFRLDLSHLKPSGSQTPSRPPVRKSQADSFKQRLTNMVLHLVATLESDYKLQRNEHLDFASRVFHLREEMINKIAAELKVARPGGFTQLEFAHNVKSVLCDQFYHERPNETDLIAQKKLYKEIVTAIDLIAIEKSCLFDSARVATQDELAEVVHWLEKVLCGKNSVYGKRRVMMQVGEPISLSEYLDQFEEDLNAATQQINKQIRLQLLTLLTNLVSRRVNVGN